MRQVLGEKSKKNSSPPPPSPHAFQKNIFFPPADGESYLELFSPTGTTGRLWFQVISPIDRGVKEKLNQKKNSLLPCTAAKKIISVFLSPICIARVSNLSQNVCCGVGGLCTLLIWSNRHRNEFGRAKKVENGHPAPHTAAKKNNFCFFKSDLHCQGFKPGPKRLLWYGCALYTLGLVQSAQEWLKGSEKGGKRTPCTNVAFGPLSDHHFVL